MPNKTHRFVPNAYIYIDLQMPEVFFETLHPFLLLQDSAAG